MGFRLRLGGLLFGLGLLVLSACASQKNPGSTVQGERNRTFVSWNFFSLDVPGDWVTRDLEDGANLFFADGMLFVGVRVYEAPEAGQLETFVQSRIKSDADVEGGDAKLLRTGNKGTFPYYYYLINKPNGQRFQEVLIHNTDLQLVYILIGRSRAEDSDEFSRIFDLMFESFQFRVTARLPLPSDQKFSPDLSNMAGTWVAFLEGLRTEDYDLLQKASARINSSKIINDANVREVRNSYFPYNSPIYTFVSQVEVRDQLARVSVVVRALPPEGFLKHEVREFIREEDHWRLLRFNRLD